MRTALLVLSIVTLAAGCATTQPTRTPDKGVISVHFDKTPVRDALMCFFRINGSKILMIDVSDEQLANTYITLDMADAPWQVEFLAVARQAQLDVTFLHKGYIRITKQDESCQQETTR